MVIFFLQVRAKVSTETVRRNNGHYSNNFVTNNWIELQLNIQDIVMQLIIFKKCLEQKVINK